VAEKKGNFDNVWGIREDARAIDDKKCGACIPHVYRLTTQQKRKLKRGFLNILRTSHEWTRIGDFLDHLVGIVQHE
jgi:hypothetical protein